MTDLVDPEDEPEAAEDVDQLAGLEQTQAEDSAAEEPEGAEADQLASEAVEAPIDVEALDKAWFRCTPTQGHPARDYRPPVFNTRTPLGAHVSRRRCRRRNLERRQSPVGWWGFGSTGR